LRRKTLRIRINARQVINWILASYALTILVLILLQRFARGWIGHGVPPAPAWIIALIIPASDIVLGLLILRAEGRLRLARAPLFSGTVLALFAAWTVWGWR
jgi:hypothetical protein